MLSGTPDGEREPGDPVVCLGKLSRRMQGMGTRVWLLASAKLWGHFAEQGWLVAWLQ